MIVIVFGGTLATILYKIIVNKEDYIIPEDDKELFIQEQTMV